MIESQLLFQCAPGEQLIDFDMDFDGVIVSLIEDARGQRRVSIGDQVRWQLNKTDPRHARHVRWVDHGIVAVWSFADRETWDSVLIMGNSDTEFLSVGSPSKLYSSGGVIYACYGEDQNIRAGATEIESNLLAAFDGKGALIFGLRDMLATRNWPGVPLEVAAACMTEGNHLLFSLYDCRDLWLLNPFDQSLEQIEFPADIRGIRALSVNDKKVYSATMHPTELRFSCFDTSNRTLTTAGAMSFGALERDNLSGRRRLPIRGKYGSFLVSTDSRAWKLKLQ